MLGGAIFRHKCVCKAQMACLLIILFHIENTVVMIFRVQIAHTRTHISTIFGNVVKGFNPNSFYKCSLLLSETNKVWNIYDDIVKRSSSCQPSFASQRIACECVYQHVKRQARKKGDTHTEGEWMSKGKTISNIRKTCHPFFGFSFMLQIKCYFAVANNMRVKFSAFASQ